MSAIAHRVGGEQYLLRSANGSATTIIVKRLDVNVYETDDGAVISRQERDYLTYSEGSDGRTARFPVETIVRTIDGNERFGLAISLRGHCRWSDGAAISASDLIHIKRQITSLLDRLDAVYRIES